MSEQTSPLPHPVLKLLVTIVNRDQVKEAEYVMRKNYVRLQFLCSARGTARSELLDVLGIQDLDRGVVLCLLPDFMVLPLMRDLYDRLGINRPGRGIVFSLPLSGVSSSMSRMFSENALNYLNGVLTPEKQEQLKKMRGHANERWEGRMNMEMTKEAYKEIRHDLIVAIINQGYSDDLMEKARAAGATGGTVVELRRLGEEDAMKFFGISVHTEKEAVAIIAKREDKAEIMRAINQFYGLTSEARGILFSLPVENLTGI